MNISTPLPDSMAVFQDWIKSEHGRTFGAFQFDTEDEIDYEISPKTGIYMEAMVDHDLVVHYLLNVRFRDGEQEMRNWLMVHMHTWDLAPECKISQEAAVWMFDEPLTFSEMLKVAPLVRFLGFIDEYDGLMG